MTAPPLTVDGERLDDMDLDLLWGSPALRCRMPSDGRVARDVHRARSDLAARVAVVREQLAPIQTEAALLESYRRESIFLLASVSPAAGGPGDVLEIAYALRWLELAAGRRAGGAGS